MNDIQKFIRNSMVIYDFIFQKVRSEYYQTNMGVGSAPIFGKTINYDPNNFAFNPRYLKSSKTSELMFPILAKYKDLVDSPHDLTARVQSEICAKMLDKGTSMVFTSMSAIGLRRDVKIDDRYKDIRDKLHDISHKQSGLGLTNLQEEEKLKIRELGDLGIIRVVTSLAVIDGTYSMPSMLETSPGVKGPSVKNKKEFLNKLTVTHVENGNKPVLYKVNEVFEDAPYFLMDLDW